MDQPDSDFQIAEYVLGANVTALAFGASSTVAVASGDTKLTFLQAQMSSLSRLDQIDLSASTEPTENGAAVGYGPVRSLMQFRGGFIVKASHGPVLFCEIDAAEDVVFDAGARMSFVSVHDDTGWIAACDDENLYLCDPSGVLNSISYDEAGAEALCFSPSGECVAMLTDTGVFVLDMQSGEKKLLRCKGGTGVLSWSPDGRFIVVSSEENTFFAWDLTRGRRVCFGSFPDHALNCAWTEDSRYFSCSGYDRLTLWAFGNEFASGPEMVQIGYSPSAKVTVVCAQPHGALIAAGFSDGTVLICGPDQNQVVKARRPDGQTITALSWSQNGAFLASGGAAGAVTLMQYGVWSGAQILQNVLAELE